MLNAVDLGLLGEGLEKLEEASCKKYMEVGSCKDCGDILVKGSVDKGILNCCKNEGQVEPTTCIGQ